MLSQETRYLTSDEIRIIIKNHGVKALVVVGNVFSHFHYAYVVGCIFLDVKNFFLNSQGDREYLQQILAMTRDPISGGFFSG